MKRKRYLPLEKAILSVVLGMRKLPHYFQAQVASLFPSAYGGCFYITPAKNHTHKCRLHGKDSQVGYNSGDFRYQVHASYLCEGTGPCRLGGRIHRTWSGWITGRQKQGWKIGGYNLPILPSDMGRTCRRSIKLKRLGGWISTDIFWEGYRWKVSEVRLSSYE